MISDEQNSLYEIVGRNIKYFRQGKKMNQLSLASKINLSRTSLVNIEQGKQHPSLFLLLNIAHSLEVTLHDLIPASVAKQNSDGNINISTKNVKDEKVREFINSRVHLNIQN